MNYKLTLFFSFLLGAIFILLPTVSRAFLSGDQNTSVYCDKKGTFGICNPPFVVQARDGNQAYNGQFFGHLDGHGGFGPGGGKGAASGCLSPSPAFGSGACNYGFIDSEGNGNIGDDDRLYDITVADIGSDYNSALGYLVVELYANDARWDYGTLTVNGRHVEVNFDSPSSTQNLGANFNVSWSTQWALDTELLSSNPGVVFCNNTGSCTAVGAGTSTLTVNARGATATGPEWAASDTITITVSAPIPGPFNLSVAPCVGGTNRFDLSWSNSSGATNYEIFARAWTSGSWNSRGTTNNTSVLLVEAYATDWYFKVVASNANGTKDSSPGAPDFTYGGSCPGPNVDIKANGLNNPSPIAYNTAATISWTSGSVDSCTVTPTSWTGISNAGISSGNLTANTTYTINCTGPIGSATDNVIVPVNTPAGGIIVISNNGDAVWTLTGTGGPIYSGGGTSQSYPSAPADRNYSISNTNLPGFDLDISPSTTQFLANTATITFDLTYLARPDISAGSGSLCNHAIIEWNDVDDNDGYVVERSTSAVGPIWTQISSTLGANGFGSNPISYDDYSNNPGLGNRPTGDTTYFYRVKAIKNSPSMVSTSNVLSIFVQGCAPNLGGSSKTLYKINGANYSYSTAIKSGDIITFRITIVNSGNDAGAINNIVDTLSRNLSYVANTAVIDKNNGCLSTSSCPTVAVTGVSPNISFTVAGNIQPTTKWVLQFDALVTFQPNTDNLIRNTATIKCAGVTNPGYNCTVTRAASYFAPGGNRPPQFREVQP